MTALLTLWQGVRRVPWQGWAVLCVLGLGVGAQRWHTGQVRATYRAGWQGALDSIAKTAPKARAGVERAKDTTDHTSAEVGTAIDGVRHAAARLRQQLPPLPTPSVTLSPTIPPALPDLLTQCERLATAAAQLRRDVLLERAAHEALASALSAELVATRDTVRQLRRRPSWKKAAAVGVVLGVFTARIRGGR